MPYEHNGFMLFARRVELKGGHVQTIYFFSKRIPKVGEAVDELPEGYDVVMNKRSGLPYLRRRA